MNKPVMLAVDEATAKLQVVEQELSKRYGADYEVICEPSAAVALHQLEALKDADRQVALPFTDQAMPEMSGIEFLHRAHDLHPDARRILLHDVGDRAVSDTVLQAMTFGWIDSYLAKPTGACDERFHSQITDLLKAWGHYHLPHPAQVQVIGERWSARGHEFRDMLDRYDTPYRFYDLESEQGRALLEQV